MVIMNELNVYQLFKDIIAKSKVIRRFIVAPQYGVELNKNNLGEILTDVIGGISDGEKYPLCIMFPPIEIPNYDTNWRRFKIKMFFLTTQYNDSLGTQNVNFNNNLSQHSIIETWKDMSSCAIDFRKTIKEITSYIIEYGIRDVETTEVIFRYSDIGNDNTAGVSIDFEIDLANDCEIKDYSIDDEFIKSIIKNIKELHENHEH